MSQKNVELAHRWFDEVWNNKRLEAIDEMASPEATGRGQVGHRETISVEQFRQFARALQTAFPDFRVTIEDTIDKGDRVVLRWQATLTHLGSFMGAAPTGKTANITGITIFRIVKGKIVQGWDNWDQLGLLVQIGAIPEQYTSLAA